MLGSSAGCVRNTCVDTVQQLLALAHKYQLSRLQLWCERELAGNISSDNVCSVLCQAHLYTASQLEKKCLEFVKQNAQEVIGSEAFQSLLQKWPAVGLLVTAHLAHVQLSEQRTGKRKRDD